MRLDRRYGFAALGCAKNRSFLEKVVAQENAVLGDGLKVHSPPVADWRSNDPSPSKNTTGLQMGRAGL